ncbi:glycosyltransferase [Sulfuricystis multivorans]|uniref:glycosyltransferase n=1 Tax=Sulfuricystis multivorans TaxID=2211108 RepID=UPI000F835A84|nr:glycosyltransferase [Sulfuricystis multivorans]
MNSDERSLEEKDERTSARHRSDSESSTGPSTERIEYESLGGFASLIALTFVGVSIWYLTWRLGTFNEQALGFSLLLYGAELYGTLTALLHLFMTWRLRIRVAPPPPAGLKVDVFIPTYNESVELVRNTLIAATHMDYPHETWLLDDGNRPEMAALAKEFGIRYLARQENTDAKAGNLNNALRHSKADFIAIFDCDHAPHKSFLTRTLGYFRDEKVAFVQTPQDFFNLDSYQHRWSPNRKLVWTEQSLFFRVIQRGKDYWNAAFFCGSCAVIRRSALDAIGGFATGSVTEDLHTSIRMHKAGYQSVYHPESLAFGLAPNGVMPFLKQRIRWGQGAMQVWRQEGVVFARGLTLAQRINYFASMATYFDGWQKAIFYIAPVIVLFTGTMPINALGAEFLWHFLPYYLLNFWVFEEVGRGFGNTLYIEQYNMGRFAGFAWATLGLFRKRLSFIVTPKEIPPRQESLRLLMPQIVILVFNATAIPVGIALFLYWRHLPISGVVANVIWAAVNLSLALGIVLFSLRQSQFRRKEYRFPIPLPALVTLADGTSRYMTVDNISSNGCKLYGAFIEPPQVGDLVRGIIFLPAGRIPFIGEVTAQIEAGDEEERFVKAIGCRFVVQDWLYRDQLKLFLYGSDLQWQLLSLTERIPTPSEWIAQKMGLLPSSSQFMPKNWAAMLYRIAGEKNPHEVGLVTMTNDRRPEAVLVFRALPKGAMIDGRFFTRRQAGDFVVQAGEERALQSPLSPMYLYQVSPVAVSHVD